MAIIVIIVVIDDSASSGAGVVNKFVNSVAKLVR